MTLLAAVPVRAQVLTLAPGATNWDATSANWLNSSNTLVPYFNSTTTTPVINGPVTVNVAEPRVTGAMTLNGNPVIGGPAHAFLMAGIPSEFRQQGAGPAVFNTPLVGFPGGTGTITLKGSLRFNRNLEAGGGHSIRVAEGTTTIGANAAITADAIIVGSQTGPFVRLDTGTGTSLVTTGDMTVGETYGRTGIVAATESNLQIGGDWLLGHGGDGNVSVDGGSVTIGGALRCSDRTSPGGKEPMTTLTLRNTRLTVGDSGGPGIRGTWFISGGDIGKLPTIQMPGTRILVRPGGFLTVDSRIDFGVNNTIVDTTGGNAVIHGRLWGRTLIKEGPGILKLTRDNRNGGGGNGILDGTIVRGGFIEFAESLNLNDGGMLNVAANQNQPPTGLRNIQLNGGGLRWAAGSTVDISARLRLLHNFSFDTNGNDVRLETAMAGTGGMTKLGDGTLTLEDNNTWSGGTTIRGGMVRFASLNSFGSGNLTIDGGGVHWGALNTADITSRLQPLGPGGAIFHTGGNDVTLAAGPVTGTGPLTKTGPGTLTLQGAHPWSGALTVDGGAMALRGTFNGKSTLIVGGTGAGSSLTLHGDSGQVTTLNASAAARIGANAGETGTVTVNGGGSLLALASVLETGSGGTGTLDVTNGGRVTVALTAALGLLPGSAGFMNVNGAAPGGAGSSMEIGSALFVGYQSTAVMRVGSGGTVTSGGPLVMGLLPGGSGAFVLEQGGTLNVGGTDGIRAGSGEYGFYLSGGTLRVTGSSLTTAVSSILTNTTRIDTNGFNAVFGGALSGAGGLSKTGAGILYLNTPGTYAGGTAMSAGQIVVPAASSLGSGPVNVTGGNLHSTGNFTSEASVSVSGSAASLTSGGFMEFGGTGAGTLAVADGGQVSIPSSAAFGVLAGARGRADVSGAGSVLTSSSTIFIGYLGDGGVTVGSGATVTAGAILLGFGPGGTGFFTLNPGGTLNVGGTDGIARGIGSGAFNFGGGLLKVISSSLTTSTPMTLTNTPTVDTSGVEATLAGTLTGPGNLTKTGAGTLTLTAANSLTGGTTVWAGTVSAATPTSLGTGAMALNGGTLQLSFSGTATVHSLSFDGTIQASGTWGSLASSAPNRTSRITGPGLLNVLTSTVPPAFNTTATGGLSRHIGGGTVDLATVSGATPPGGTFSGPGVSGGSFDPAAAGYGTHTITYSQGGQSATFTISVTGGLTLEEEGGTASPGNLAPAGIAFAKDSLNHPSHAIHQLNDGNYGNGSSWIGTSTNSFGGVRFGAAGFAVSRIAFGRDNTGAITDRSLDYYTVQYTADSNPEAPGATWTTIGAVDYRPGGTAGITNPARRHLFSFTPVNMTGLRVVTASEGTAIDEIEIYPAAGLFATSGLTLLQESGTLVPDNLAPGGTAFSRDEIGVDPHATFKVNNATYGNASSWIGGTANSFVGVALPAAATIDRIAFGRDNTGFFTDRSLGRYTIQYTTVASPGASTPDGSWTTLGILDYQSPGGVNFQNPSQRHLFGFPAISATGIRILTPVNAAIDEIEMSLGRPQLRLEQPAGTNVAFGSTVDFGGRFPALPLVKTFTVTNDGSSSVTLGDLTVSGVHLADFTVSAPVVSLLPPGAGTTFSVTFTPGGTGARSAGISIRAAGDPMPPFAFNVSGSGLAPSFNAATASGLIVDTAGGLRNLTTLTGATPPGGMFTGPGIASPLDPEFDPAAAGYGVHSLTYTYAGASASFTISVTGGLTLVAEGGSFAAGNIAPSRTAFAKDVIPGYEAHAISHLNDATFGNANSWIGDSDGSFAGISLGASPVAVNRIAFGRDNSGFFNDRAVDHYIIQFTTVPNPDATTTAWTSIGAVDYRSPSIMNPALRHLFSFPAVNATGLRIITATAGTGIDELEVYPVLTPHEAWRQHYFGSPANSGSGADNADPDHNGIPNLQEYALGGNPATPDSSQSHLPTAILTGDQLEFRLTRLTDRSDLILTVEASSDLTTWTPLARSTAGQAFIALTAGTVIDESGTGLSRAVRLTTSSGSSRRCLRLSVAPMP